MLKTKSLKWLFVFVVTFTQQFNGDCQLTIDCYHGFADSIPDDVINSNTFESGYATIIYNDKICSFTLYSSLNNVEFKCDYKIIEQKSDALDEAEGEGIETLLKCVGLFDTVQIAVYNSSNVSIQENNLRLAISGDIRIQGTLSKNDFKSNAAYNPNRKVITPPTMNYHGLEQGKVALHIWIDEFGNVVECEFLETKSTTGSTELIEAAKSSAFTMKYEKKPGAKTEYVGYQIFEFNRL